jgi:hypothetical protein
MTVRRFQVPAHETAGLAAAADLLDQLGHTGVARVADFATGPKGAQLTVAPVGICKLGEWTPPGPAEVARVWTDLCEVVAYLHDNRVQLGPITGNCVEVTHAGLPLLTDPRGWQQVAVRSERCESWDVAGLGRLLLGGLARTHESPCGWSRQMSGFDRRHKTLVDIARGAESGRICSAHQLGGQCAQLSADTDTPRERSLTAAVSTSTARMAASNLRSLPRIVRSEPVKS